MNILQINTMEIEDQQLSASKYTGHHIIVINRYFQKYKCTTLFKTFVDKWIVEYIANNHSFN